MPEDALDGLADWHEFKIPAVAANLLLAPFSMLSILIFCSMALTSEAAGLKIAIFAAVISLRLKHECCS